MIIDHYEINKLYKLTNYEKSCIMHKKIVKL